MSDILYKAAVLLPMNTAPISAGAILVRSGRIVAVGPASTLQQASPQADIVDFGGSILMPPLVNAHTHLELTDYPRWQKTDDAPLGEGDFADWILEVIRVKRTLQPDDYIASMQNGLRQSLLAGTGVVVDILSRPELAAVYGDSPLLGRIDCELIGQTAVTPQQLERAEQWLAGRQRPGLDRGLSPHAPYTVAADTLAAIVTFAEVRRAALSIHVAESQAECDLLLHSGGPLAEKLYPAVGWPVPDPPQLLNPVEYLSLAGALRPSTLLVHAVHLSPDEIGRVGRVGSSVVLCPRSNERLKVGIAPVEQFVCRGLNLTLGTDSLASNDSLSVWDEMAAARRIFAGLLTPVQILAMATINGSRALGLQDEVGVLKPGAGAHFLVLQPKTLPPLERLPEFLCHGERQGDISHLFLNGIDVLPTA